MDIKYILGILVIILLISNIFCVYNMQFSNQNLDENAAIIGDKVFKLPENYSLNNEVNPVEISNGEDTIHIYKFNGTDIDSAINDYKNQYSDNFTIKIADFDSKFNDKKTIAMADNDEVVTEYWFELSDGVYQIQVYKDDIEFNKVAKDIINSMNY